MTPLELIAHDIICICKYGSPGGSASATEIKRVVEYLDRVRVLPEQPKPAPRVVLNPPKITIGNSGLDPCSAFKVAPPNIKLPGAP